MQSSLIVGFSRNKGLFSRLINLICGDKETHCFMYIPAPQIPGILNDVNVIYHAAALNVHYISEENFFKMSKGQEILSLWEIPVTKERAAWAKRQRFVEAGKKYGISLIFGHLAKILLKRLFNLNIKTPFSDGKESYICVEVCCNQLGITDVAEEWTVGDLYRFVSKMEGAKSLLG